MKAANLATRPLRRSPSATRAYVRLAQQVGLILLPELKLLQALKIGSYVTSHMGPHIIGEAPVGDWTMPGFSLVAQCTSGGSPSHMLAQAALLSLSQEANINSCLGNQVATGAIVLPGSVPSGYRGVWFLEYTHDASPGNPRYAARQGYERPSGGVTQAVRTTRAIVMPKLGVVTYTKLPDLTMLEPKLEQDLTLEMKPDGSGLKLRPGQVRTRPAKGVREVKRKPWAKVVAMYLSRGTEYLSEFYEFVVNATEALDYQGRDTMGAKIKWLFWEGHIDDLDYGEIDTLIRQNTVEDMMYGRWQKSFKQATKPNFPRNPEIGNALDSWQL